MDVFEFCDKVEEVINRLANESVESVGPWEFGATEPKDDSEHSADFVLTLQGCRQAFPLAAKTLMFGVFVEGSDVKLAMCGNTPSSATRAQFIAAMSPANVRLLIDHVRANKAEGEK